MRILPSLGVVLLLGAGCSYDYARLRDGTGIDGGQRMDSGPRCAEHTECDDADWCNGSERCAPRDPSADGFGCVPGIPRCVVSGECFPAEQRCGSGCVDEDGDGYEATSCGGTDCDDGDARRNPGGTERCDAAGLDEDCNPATFGELDADGDGFLDAACCNGDFCGDDCDDDRDAVHPGATEVCNEIDDDCDGRIDEGVQNIYYRDADGDGYGAPAPTIHACSRPAGYSDVSTDCDDMNANRNPGRTEVCGNGIDDNCDRRIDEGCSM